MKEIFNIEQRDDDEEIAWDRVRERERERQYSLHGNNDIMVNFWDMSRMDTLGQYV